MAVHGWGWACPSEMWCPEAGGAGRASEAEALNAEISHYQESCPSPFAGEHLEQAMARLRELEGSSA